MALFKTKEQILIHAKHILWEGFEMRHERNKLHIELGKTMGEQNQTVLHKKTLEQKVEEAVDRLIELGKIKPEERGVTIQALLRANQGYLGGDDETEENDNESGETDESTE